MMRGMLQALGLTVFLITILFIPPFVLASAGWIKTYEGIDRDLLTPKSTIQTQDAGFVTAIFGYIRRSDSQGRLITDSYELQVLKTDSNGNLQWKKSYPTIEDPNHENPTIYTSTEDFVIVQTSDQCYVVAGGGFWLFKIDTQGTTLWSKTYTSDESSGGAHLYSMIQTSDGGFALAGSINTNDGGEDYWLVKTNFQGEAQWNRTYNSGSYTDGGGYVNPRSDQATCVIQTKDGGYALVGSASLYSSTSSSMTYSSWVVKTDAQGNQEWNKGYDLLNIFGFKSTIIQTSDNGYAIAGTQNNDFCLFKIKSSNQFEWSQLYGDPQTDYPCSLIQLEDDGYALAGTWAPNNTTYIRDTMGLLRTDASGKLSWTKAYSARDYDANTLTYSRDVAYAMIRTIDGAYALVGSTQFSNEIHQDVFFVKTETLEQAPQTTPIPTPASSESLPTENPEQTAQPSSNPTQTGQTTQPSSTNNQSTSENDIIQLFNQDGTWIIIAIAVIAIVIVVSLALVKIKKKS